MYKRIMVFLLAALVMASGAQAAGNEWNDSFSKAKKTLERQVYYDHRITLYCGAAFDEKKNVTLPEGFTAAKHEKRAGKVEWEHVVPAENFGQAFAEWREGDAQCVDNRGKAFKGRKCAEKASREYRLMQADLYNLYPAVGAVNALLPELQFPDAAGRGKRFRIVRNEDLGQEGRARRHARGGRLPHVQVYERGIRAALPDEPPAAAAHGRVGQDVPGGSMGMHAGQAHRNASRQQEPLRRGALQGGRALVAGRP